jgi:glycerophosphoryl diester phosphodiesterase
MADVKSRARRAVLTAPARPLVVAHRGASTDKAEHTLAAYVSALDAGADGLECDVRLTRDGHLICVHDRTVDRTSNGRGVVSELELRTLQELDFASRHRELPDSADELIDTSPYLAGVAPDRTDDGRVLTLEQLLELVADAGRAVRLLIETKHPTRYGGLVEKELVGLLARFGWAGRPGPPVSTRQPPDLDNPVVVMSFAPTAIRRVRLLAPDIPTVLLLERQLPVRRERLLPPGVAIAGPAIQLLQRDPGFVSRAHARGYRVYVWTVNEPDEVELATRLGADTLITDRPAAVLALLAKIGTADAP